MCKERYINPFTDFGFKKLFGTAANKGFLISFLNSLFDDEDKIIDITYRNVEQLGMRTDNRNAVFDLYCTTESGGHIIVEMQNGYQRFFIDRSIYYSSFPMQEAAKRGDWDFQLPKIFTVAFLNFNMSDFVDVPKYKHMVRLVDQYTGREFYKKLTYIYLEMKKYDKTLDNLDLLESAEDPEKIFDIWMYVIKNLDKFDEIPPALRHGLFERFFREAEIAAFSPDERFAYEMSLKAYRDYNNTIRTAVEDSRAKAIEEGLAQGMAQGLAQGMAEGMAKGMAEGMAQGMAQGMSQGMVQAREEVAKKMLGLGLDTNLIMTATGLTLDELKSLRTDKE